ncbi:hypothetical protein A2755_01980 [Candidatus Wolfebacteria bacterium RIFCSPHIGHO2_01_FULL_48_22]|uniref:Uncharacterized protein n=2 Tax=Candidatus Wolfeibacteriota TaxID=1752735 RepID=A0A1F8DT11_9BACT|nr:MAG: hypothetical protein A2755_01980 [Candidatus Wolfebacteria bacterium RIFCSPHIGHO2_01_FULL_48_22]OGM91999.1 MAG: hypothetical protein A2935_02620 [Candidatus Wolfebacteria bacterium RIFCSPLOWO2_01_FULL_47_17b]
MLSLLKNIRRIQYYLMLTFSDDGLAVHRFTYNAQTKKITESRSFTLRGVQEKQLSQNKILRFILKIIYFPFHYRLLLQIPHQFCQSRYEAVVSKREKSSEQARAQELNSFLTHAVWKLVEKNKKLFMASRKYDDVNTLLAQNSLVSAAIGTKDILHIQEDSITSITGPDMRVGIVQTHLYRPIYTELAKILPKRARIQSALENGFAVAYGLRSASPTLVCIVERSRTNVFLSSAQEVAHAGSFNFGAHSLYEACNNMLGIGKDAYRAVLQRYVHDGISPAARKFIEKILHDELSRLQKGILSFKKETGVKDAYVEAGMLNYFISEQKKFPARLIPFKAGDTDSHATSALQYALSLEEKSYMRHLMKKLFRWLLPNIIE